MGNEILLSPIPLDTLRNEFKKIVNDAIDTLKPSEESLINTTQACELFNPPISKVTLIKWTSTGKLKSYRIGGRVYYKRSEIFESAKHLRKYGRAE